MLLIKVSRVLAKQQWSISYSTVTVFLLPNLFSKNIMNAMSITKTMGGRKATLVKWLHGGGVCIQNIYDVLMTIPPSPLLFDMDSKFLKTRVNKNKLIRVFPFFYRCFFLFSLFYVFLFTFCCVTFFCAYVHMFVYILMNVRKDFPFPANPLACIIISQSWSVIL